MTSRLILGSFDGELNFFFLNAGIGYDVRSSWRWQCTVKWAGLVYHWRVLAISLQGFMTGDVFSILHLMYLKAAFKSCFHTFKNKLLISHTEFNINYSFVSFYVCLPQTDINIAYLLLYIMLLSCTFILQLLFLSIIYCT